MLECAQFAARPLPMEFEMPPFPTPFETYHLSPKPSSGLRSFAGASTLDAPESEAIQMFPG
jgi:hypothetical protein